MIFVPLCIAAMQFQTSTNVIPIDQSAYLVETQIEKVRDEKSQVVAAPRVICFKGKPSQIAMGSEEDADFISIDILIPENSETVQTSVSIRENHEVIFQEEKTTDLPL